MIKVLLVDDHVMVRKALGDLLLEDKEITIVGEASNGEEAVKLTERLKPDIVVMDLEMPVLSGLEATRKIKEIQATVKVLILTHYESENHLFSTLQAGASGYALKRGQPEELITAIKSVQEGLVYLTPHMTGVLVSEIVKEPASKISAKNPLTLREQEILKLISEGMTNQKIADKLQISIKTVQAHRANLMVKLNLHDRTELVKYAIAKGLISIEKPNADSST